MNLIEHVLMVRDELDYDQAHDWFCDAAWRVAHGANGEKILKHELGLEVDYIHDLYEQAEFYLRNES